MSSADDHGQCVLEPAACARCGYGLCALGIHKQCPQCGEWVARSLDTGQQAAALRQLWTPRTLLRTLVALAIIAFLVPALGFMIASATLGALSGSPGAARAVAPWVIALTVVSLGVMLLMGVVGLCTAVRGNRVGRTLMPIEGLWLATVPLGLFAIGQFVAIFIVIAPTLSGGSAQVMVAWPAMLVGVPLFVLLSLDLGRRCIALVRPLPWGDTGATMLRGAMLLSAGVLLVVIFLVCTDPLSGWEVLIGATQLTALAGVVGAAGLSDAFRRTARLAPQARPPATPPPSPDGPTGES